jgi:Transmembrane secretion effector
VSQHRLPPLRRNRDFVLLEAGQLLSTAGTNISGIAFPLLVLAETHSPAKAGLVQAARFAPMVLLSPFAGAAADQRNRRRLMIGADVVSALAIGTLVAAIATGRVPFLLILAVAFADACASVYFLAAKSGAFRSVVPKAQLPNAASVEMGRASTVRLAAPPIGGALFGIARILPFAADVASYVFSTVSILLMRTPFQEERPRDTSPLRRQLAEGFRFLWNVPVLRISAVMIGVSNFGVTACQFALIVLAKRHGLSAAAIGGLVALTGLTTLAGSIASPLLRRVLSLPHILLSEFWAVYGVIAFFIWPNVYVLAAALAVQAFCFPNTDAAINAYRYAMTPDRLVSRVVTVATTIVVAVMPLGPLAAGFLLDNVSAQLTIFLLTVGTMVAAVIGTLSRAVRELPPLAEVVTPSPSASPVEAG